MLAPPCAAILAPPRKKPFLPFLPLPIVLPLCFLLLRLRFPIPFRQRPFPNFLTFDSPIFSPFTAASSTPLMTAFISARSFSSLLAFGLTVMERHDWPKRRQAVPSLTWARALERSPCQSDIRPGRALCDTPTHLPYHDCVHCPQPRRLPRFFFEPRGFRVASFVLSSKRMPRLHAEVATHNVPGKLRS